MFAFTAAALAGFIGFALARQPAHIFVWGVAALVLWISSSPIMESATLRAAEAAQIPYGRVRVWLSIAFVAGNVLSGFAIAASGYAIVPVWFVVCAGLQLAAIATLPRAAQERETGSFALRFQTTLAEAQELIRKPLFLLFLLACSLIQGSHIVYYTYAGLTWRAQGFSATTIGLIWPLGVLAEIALFAYSGAFVRRIDAVTLMLIGAVAAALRWAIMAFDPSLPVLIAAQFLHGLTFAVPHLGAMYFILRATPPRLSATAQSLYSVFGTGLGSSLALLPASYLYARSGSAVYAMMSLMAVFAFGFALLLKRRWNGGRLTETAASSPPA
jgi:PPP family 3-phenylpropionic acid transporter